MSKTISTVKHGLTALAVTALALGGTVGLGVGAANAMGSTGSLGHGRMISAMGSTGSLGHGRMISAPIDPSQAMPGQILVPMAP
ncbi:hypothetical protein G4X40_08965 [Rhodococcus sp. D2-41]|uniref:Uncharacterized protein n=1 Tax=Speluncibacter jeojiensis TaxID=2710754 RepID=A0A9X4M0M3_9ACTN|nr:hypothetical protein [Rhodococcus sp. D2-41]MDG3010282.1 hypothetical protein [Rhodococcus sp. D2-41]MDG3015795.1 hypothetical protein [Corynebacteriales bacterium D3-21]